MTELAQVPVTALKGVGDALAEKLAKVGLETLQDVLFHLPLRYQDRTRITPSGALRPGQDAVVEGVVAGADVAMGRRRSLLVRLQDGTGTLSLRFFHFSQAQKDGLKRGTALRCYGEIRPGATGYSLALLTMLMLWVQDTWGRAGLQLTPEQIMRLTMEVIGTVTYLATTTTVWWFGVRPAQRR